MPGIFFISGAQSFSVREKEETIRFLHEECMHGEEYQNNAARQADA